MDCVHVVSRLSSCPIVLVLCTIRCIVFPLAIVLGSRPWSRAQIVLCIVAMYTMDIVDIKTIVFLTHPSIHPCIHPSIHPSVYPSIRPSIHPYIHTYMHTTQLVHTQLTRTYSSTHNLLHTNPSPSLFPFLLSPCHLYLSFAACWKKLTCGVIRSFNFGQKIF